MSITTDARTRMDEATGGRKCPSCGERMAEILTREGLAMHPTCEPLDRGPDEVATEIFTIIQKAVTTRPRDLQVKVGPSEIGHPCDRRLGYSMLNVPKSNDDGVNWKAFIGTAVHEQFADFMAAAEELHEREGNTVRWHMEERVSSGLVINGEDIDGSCDLFDAWTGTVWDWKFTTRNKIRETYRRSGPGDQYRVQAHEYGAGWAAKGFSVKHVGIIFMTRDGEFNDRHVWHEAFDPAIVTAAHDRVERIDRSRGFGPQLMLTSLQTADAYCNYCPWHDARATDLAIACPGHPKTEPPPRDPSQPLLASI